MATVSTGWIWLTPSGDTSGVTDDANITGAFATMAAITGVGGVDHYLVLSPGQYYSQQKNVFTFANAQAARYWFIGHGAVINQTATNTGTWEFQSPDGAISEGIFIRGIGFKYMTQQTSANTSSVHLGFRATQTSAVGSQGIWGVYIEECQFQFGYRAIANTQPSGQFPLWDIHIAKCLSGGTAGAPVWISSPSAVGQPNISVRDCEFGTPYLGGSEAIVNIQASNNVTLDNVEILGAVGVPLYSLGSINTLTMNACKGEACTTTGNVAVLNLQNVYSGTITGFCLNSAVVNGGRLVSVGNGNAGEGITVSGLAVTVASGTGTLTLFNGSILQITCINPPAVNGLGLGPAVVNLFDNTITTGNVLNMLTYPGGEMSDDYGNTSLTFLGYAGGGAGTATPHVNVWNSMTVGQTVTLSNSIPNTNNLWDGVEFYWVVTANCIASLTINLQVPASKIAAPGSWGKANWRRSLGWVETASGTL